MKTYRFMAMAVTTCAVGLSLAACSAGISAKSPVTPRSPDTSSTASSPGASSPAASPSPTASAAASPADTISVAGPIGSFPIPHGAQVVANMPCAEQSIIELSSVTPVQAQTFYASALPRAGYTIRSNILASDPKTGAPQGIAEIMFSGHRYTGLILATANLGAEASADPSIGPLPSNVSKNFVEISLIPPGKSNTPSCVAP
jgi:hypothetical protein